MKRDNKGESNLKKAEAVEHQHAQKIPLKVHKVRFLQKVYNRRKENFKNN